MKKSERGWKREKKAYQVLKKERDIFIGREEDAMRREMMKGLARIAAGLGMRRKGEVSKDSDGEDDV